MRHLRFLPLAFVAGVDGFDLFAPYAAVVLVAVPLIRMVKAKSATNTLPLVAAAATA